MNKETREDQKTRVNSRSAAASSTEAKLPQDDSHEPEYNFDHKVGEDTSEPQPTAIPTSRWTMQQAPLKISYWFGSPDAPKEVKDILANGDANSREKLKRMEKCILLTWPSALAVLHLADFSLFHFHPQDYDWQVNGWKFTQEGGTLAPLTEDQLRTFPHLPTIPSNADIFAEVMVRYSHDIDQMEQRNQRLFKTLSFEQQAWMEPALRGLTFAENGLNRLDGRALCRRLYEIMATGRSDINPTVDSVTLDQDEATSLRAAIGIPRSAIQ
jgi:hypothetical protein